MNTSPLYYSAINSHTIMPFAATWMDLEIILSEISQRQILHDKMYVESKKMIWMNLFTK